MWLKLEIVQKEKEFDESYERRAGYHFLYK